MTAFTWIGRSGNWDSGSSWTPNGGPPTAADTATINATGTYTVTINSADVAQTVILDSAGATIKDVAGGSLAVGGTLGIDTGTYDLLGGTLTAAHIRIQHGGLLEGSGTIGATVTNNGKIDVSSGALVFERQVNSSSSKRGTETVSGGADLEFDKKVFSSQDIVFGAGGGNLSLIDPKVFFGHLHDFGTGDVIGLVGAWSFESLSHPTSGTTDLVLDSSGGPHKFVFAGGGYTQSDFVITPFGPNTHISFA
jgi:hypothetical protein